MLDQEMSLNTADVKRVTAFKCVLYKYSKLAFLPGETDRAFKFRDHSSFMGRIKIFFTVAFV